MLTFSRSRAFISLKRVMLYTISSKIHVCRTVLHPDCKYTKSHLNLIASFAYQYSVAVVMQQVNARYTINYNNNRFDRLLKVDHKP